MIRRLLMTCAIVILGQAGMVSKANAQSIDVPFSGTVGGNCTFSDVTPGKLVVNRGTNATTLAAGYTGGVMGKVSVTCNRSSSITVSKPVQTSGPSFTPIMADGYVDSPVGRTSSTSSPLRISSIGRAIPLEVDMKVDKGSTLAPGTYGFKTTLTVTPQ
ncbi:MAG: hypothetical protein ACFB2X_06290 [Rivularia sp. (in: cyanobacteria)]